jgi:hypothetical protein
MTRAQTFCLAVVLISLSARAQVIDAKLNDLSIAVHDLSSAIRLYSSLGFSMSEGGRSSTTGKIDNSMLAFREGGGLALFQRREGAPFRADVDLEVTSAEQTERDLNVVGLKMNAPTPGSRTWNVTNPDGPVTTKWLSLRFAETAASRPIYFVQILDPEAFRAARPRPAHPNSASALTGVLVAVNDLEKAAAGYGHIGKVATREIPLPEFGAVAKEIVLARGSILLLRASDPAGATAQQLRTRGEGILGLRLSVADLDRTHTAIGEKNVSKDARSVLVSPENAAGVWLQFQAR